jgi:hypothetical protein
MALADRLGSSGTVNVAQHIAADKGIPIANTYL